MKKEKLLAKIEPKWHFEEHGTLALLSEGKEIHLEISDKIGGYAEIWLDFEDVLLLHQHLGDFIKTIK